VKISIRTEKPGNLYDELIEAITIVQLGRPLSPSHFSAAEIIELVDVPIAGQQIQIRQLLAPLNHRGLSEQVLSVLSVRIHLCCEWALAFRQTSGMRVSRSNRRARVSDWTPAGSLKRELRGVVRAADADRNLVHFAKVIAALSPAAFDLLMRRLVPKKTTVEMLAQLLCRGGTRDAALAALQDKSLDHRPSMPAHDAAVTIILKTYEALTGNRARRSTRGTRPSGAAHVLLLKISALYPGLSLVSASSDRRLRRTK
jgi:hypothetical protein